MSGQAAPTAVLYGIAACDSCREARRWLDRHGVTYRFHDLRADGLDRSMLEDWLDALGWEQLINRRSRTWRELPPARREGLDRAKAAALILEQPLLIKRPLLIQRMAVHLGFSAEDYARLFPT